MEQEKSPPEVDLIKKYSSPDDELDIRERQGGQSERERDGRSLDEDGNIIPTDPERTKRYFRGEYGRDS